MPIVNQTVDATTKNIVHVPTQTGKRSEYAHALEPELVGATIPRVARLRSKSGKLQRILWNLLFVCIGLIGFFWRRSFDTWNALLARGVVVQAPIDNKWVEQSKSPSYYLGYRFQTDGGVVQGTQTVSEALYEATSWGTSVTVTYLPGTNGKVWREGKATTEERNEQLLWWFVGASTVVIGFGSAIIWSSSTAKEQLDFLRRGVAVHGRVHSGKVIPSSPETYQLSYTYWVGDGTRSDTMLVSRKQYFEMTEGNPYFTLLYDATSPERNMPYFKIKDAYLVAAGETPSEKVSVKA